MKKLKSVTASFLSLLVIQSTLVACSKPKQREEVVNKAIVNKLVVISDLHDVSSDSEKAYFYSEKKNESLKDSTPQIKIDDNAQKVLAQVSVAENKTALTEHLKSGVISFLILGDQIKIFKVLTKDQLNTETKSNIALTRADLKLLKNPTLTDLSAQSEDEIRFVEITSIQVTKSGVLENEKTKYYEEKMSVLNVAERELGLSTHLILSDEKKTTEPQ